MSALAARLAGLDPHVRAIAKVMWRAHGLPRHSDLSGEQAGLVGDWLDWMLGEGDGWPEPAPVELPPAIDLDAVEPSPIPADAVFHECGDIVSSYGIRYQRLLRPGDACPDCGFDPLLPIPDLDAAHHRLLDVLGPADALVWARALTHRIGEAA